MTSNIRPLVMYNEADYLDITTNLPNIIDQAKLLASKVIEPTIDEQNDVMTCIKDFLRVKQRIIYGGTAIDAAIKNIILITSFYCSCIICHPVQLRRPAASLRWVNGQSCAAS